MRIFSSLVPWSNENKSYMTVEKLKFAREFSQLSCPAIKQLMRVEKREFA